MNACVFSQYSFSDFFNNAILRKVQLGVLIMVWSSVEFKTISTVFCLVQNIVTYIA